MTSFLQCRLALAWCVVLMLAFSALPSSESRAQAPDSNAGRTPIQTPPAEIARDATDADSTESDASKVGAQNLLHAIRYGGPLLIPILVCSFILVVFGLERTISLRRGRVIPRPFVRRFIHQLQDRQLDADEALDLCEENGSPVAQVFAAAVKKWNRPAVEVEQAILDEGERVTNQLKKYLRLFNGIYTISPLLGLLGTVVGMISAFNSVATMDAMGRAELLAGGISQALITTAAGLTVAIPAVIIYLYFVSRVDRLIIEIDELGQQVVNAVAADGWKDKRSGRRSGRTKAA